MDNLNLFIFSWNTQSLLMDNHDFIDTLLLKTLNKDIIVIGLQEDSFETFIEPGSQIINNIKNKLTNYNHYSINLPGWGITTFNYLKQGLYRPRGLKLSIFIKKEIPTTIEKASWVCPDIKNMITYGKGCTAINVKISFFCEKTKTVNLTFLNMHLPFNAASLIDADKNYIKKRKKSMLWQAKCLKYFYDKASSQWPQSSIFILGDLNFRIIRDPDLMATITQSFYNNPITNINELQNLDELSILLSYSNSSAPGLKVLPLVVEGVDEEGPKFYPTSKLDKKRFYKTGKFNQRMPSWCDRILYTPNLAIKCLSYYNWDDGEMKKSDHSAVIGEFIV